MQHRNQRSTGTSYNRAQRLITARANPDPAVGIQAEVAIASELLDASIIDRDALVRPKCHLDYRDLTPFAATESFAKALHAAMVQFAIDTAGNRPKPRKYDPLFAAPVMFKDTWTSRQVIDELGMPYDVYTQHAMAYWIGQGNTRIPRPTQLCSPDVVAHVLTRWATANHNANTADTPPNVMRAA